MSDVMLSRNPHMNEIAWLEPGQSYVVWEDEWQPKTPFSSYFRQYARWNNIFRQRNFRIQKLRQDRKGWLVTREPD